jgi:hypothetical protein
MSIVVRIPFEIAGWEPEPLPLGEEAAASLSVASPSARRSPGRWTAAAWSP